MPKLFRVGTALVLLVGMAAAAGPAPVSPAALNQATQKLVGQTAVVRVLADKLEAKQKERAIAESRRDALQRKLATTSDPRYRAVLQDDLAKVSRQIDAISATLLEMHKTTGKEAREQQRLADESKALAVKAAKLDVDSKTIDAAMKEAREKADTAIEQANQVLALGIVHATLQRAGAAANVAGDAGVLRP